jgi:hypothetical protein
VFIYSVYQPAGAGGSAAERSVFVRQAFDRMAFLLTPLWAIWRGLWRMLGLWALWAAFVGGVTYALRLDAAAASLVYAIGALAFGLEADRAREDALSRRGMLLQGLSVGETARDAERIYFDRIAARMTPEFSVLPAASPIAERRS